MVARSVLAIVVALIGLNGVSSRHGIESTDFDIDK